jgi:hypothetical protein
MASLYLKALRFIFRFNYSRNNRLLYRYLIVIKD